MGRRNTVAQFAQLVAAARAIAPDIAITTDIIAGFPGETDADFATSLRFVEQMNFARLHIFPYSERSGTPAVRLPGVIARSVRSARAAQMRALGTRLSADYQARFIGQTLNVLWERRDDANRWRGLTDNYLVVVAESERDLYNRVTRTYISACDGLRLIGSIVVG